MYNEIMNHLEKQLSPKDLERFKNKVLHLGVLSEPFLKYMLEGEKTIESRFSKNKIAPYNQIKKEDIVLVKKSSGKILAYFTIKEVLFFDLSVTPIEDIKEKYNKQLCVDEAFWQNKKNSHFATLIKLDNLVKLDPFSINKKGMQTWIKLEKKTETNLEA